LLGKLTKGAKGIELKASLLEEQVSTLEKANNAAIKRRGSKKNLTLKV